MNTAEIRGRFLEFYRNKGFSVSAGGSLIHPAIQTSFVFSVGFIEVKNVISNNQGALLDHRVALVQRCFRHFDLVNVGDAQHLSFFEMAGALRTEKWTKFEVLQDIYELLTAGYGLNKGSLIVTVFGGDIIYGQRLAPDSDSIRIWKDLGFNENQIAIGDRNSNFWEEGASSGKKRSGISGVHTEVFYDRGEKRRCKNSTCSPFCPCGRFVEVVNNVFITYEGTEQKGLELLPNPVAESGVGIERLAMAIQGVDSIYETDLLHPLLELSESLVSDRSVARDFDLEKNLRITIDHVRALVFLLADGARPGNRGRKSVVRKLFRRVVNAIATFNPDVERTITVLAEEVIVRSAALYPDLIKKQGEINEVLRRELAHLCRAR